MSKPKPGTWERYWQGDSDARSELIEAYWSLVQYVGTKVADEMPSNVERDDLVSHGVLGLIDAIGKFNPDRGVKFETYAITRIRGAILDELRSNDWVPRSVRSNARKVERARVELEAETEQEPPWRDVADRAGLPLSTTLSTISQVQQSSMASLDDAIPSAAEGVITLGETVSDPASSPESSFHESEVREALASAVGRLQERDQIVVALHYVVGLTLSQIGRLIGVTESRVCQMHTSAVLGLHSELVGA